MTLTDIIEDPRAQVGGLLAGIVGLFNVDFVVSLTDALFASAPQLFSAVSVGLLTLPEVYPPRSIAEWAVIAIGGLFLAYLLFRIRRNFTETL